MRKLYKLGAVATITIALLGCTGCANMGKYETAGTAVGAVAGGITGAHFGSGSGHILGAAIGAGAGALVGNVVGQQMDK